MQINILYTKIFWFLNFTPTTSFKIIRKSWPSCYKLARKKKELSKDKSLQALEMRSLRFCSWKKKRRRRTKEELSNDKNMAGAIAWSPKLLESVYKLQKNFKIKKAHRVYFENTFSLLLTFLTTMGRVMDDWYVFQIADNMVCSILSPVPRFC